MVTPEAKLKTPNLKYNPNSKIQNPKPKTLRVQPLISTDLFFKQLGCEVILKGLHLRGMTKCKFCAKVQRIFEDFVVNYKEKLRTLWLATTKN